VLEQYVSAMSDILGSKRTKLSVGHVDVFMLGQTDTRVYDRSQINKLYSLGRNEGKRICVSSGRYHP
jgi:hypothetical protein